MPQLLAKLSGYGKIFYLFFRCAGLECAHPLNPTYPF
jgi:hypothetical protein